MSDTEVTEKKTRKQRVAGPKAPSRKDNPAAYQLHYLRLAIKNVQKRDEQTTGWGVDALGANFRDALASLQDCVTGLEGVPSDFKAPRKRGAGGGRTAKVFTPGQTIKLSNPAIGRVREFFPDVSTDCTFVVSPKYTGTTPDGKPDNMIPVMCTGLNGELPAFYVGREHKKELSAA